MTFACKLCGEVHPQPCSELRRLALELPRPSGPADQEEARRIAAYEAGRRR
jgi:hypothetical protein